MFISDFAIKRPIITVVSMLALVVVRHHRAVAGCRPTSSPTWHRPSCRWRCRIPARRPKRSRREILDPIEEAIASISGVKKVNGPGRGRLRASS